MYDTFWRRPEQVPFFYLLMGPLEETELATAELEALTGCPVRGRVAAAPAQVDVSRAAYTRFCAQQLAVGSNLSELCAAVTDSQLAYDDFCVQVYRPAPKVEASPTQITRSIADCIWGHPNLDNPRTELAVVLTPGCWRLGRIISRSNQRWRRQAHRPHHYSHALPAQMARALVNMAAAPGEVLLDACCGVGTVVAEALDMGVWAVGVEANPKLAARAAANLRALSLPVNIVVGDARTFTGNFTAAVIDFPYGLSTPVPPGLYAQILSNLRPQVSRMALVMNQPSQGLLEGLSLRLLGHTPVTKGKLTRHIYVAVPTADC